MPENHLMRFTRKKSYTRTHYTKHMSIRNAYTHTGAPQSDHVLLPWASQNQELADPCLNSPQGSRLDLHNSLSSVTF